MVDLWLRCGCSVIALGLLCICSVLALWLLGGCSVVALWLLCFVESLRGRSGCFEVNRRLLLSYFEILSDRFQVAVGCPQVALRFLSGCFQVVLKSLWMCVNVVALQLL